jgi:hypothetical protein
MSADNGPLVGGFGIQLRAQPFKALPREASFEAGGFHNATLRRSDRGTLSSW